ncbi:MAG: two-component regulator propeller domain-containing protein [Candidatus Cyclobacteriaceae bacterium M3_2C_046]
MSKSRIIVCLILMHLNLWAGDNQQFLFDHLNTTQGLSNDNVFSIIQDAYGFIWIATSDGLNRYNGYDFTLYKHNYKDSSSLADNSLNSKNALFIDLKKRLWIGTANGISRYLPESDNFKNYYPDDTKMNEPGYNTITGICEDTDGTLYFSTGWGLIFSLKAHETELKLIHPNRFGSKITDLILNNRQLWISSGNTGLFRFDLEDSVITHFGSSSFSKVGNNTSIIDIYKKDSLLYLAIEAGGIFSCDLKTLTFKQEKVTGLVSPLIINEIDDELWIGARDGFYIRSKTGEVKKISTHSTNPYGLHSDAKTIFKDDQGNIWIGGTMGGVNLLRNSSGFKRYIPNENSNLNLSTEKVSSFLFDDSGRKLWVGYFSGEIDRFTLDTSKLYPNYGKEALGMAEGSGTVFNLFKDKDDRLWACTSSHGLKVYHPKKGQFQPYRLRIENNNQIIQANDIRSVCQDPDGMYWIVVHGKGLCKYDILKDEQIYFFIDSGPVDKSISNIYGFDILYDGNGYVWMSTSYGLNRIDYKTLQVKKYYYDDFNSTSIAGNNASTMFLDNHKRLWIATNRGLSIYNRKKDIFFTIDDNNGLEYPDIRGITQDSSGTLWASSRMGISRIQFPDNFNNPTSNQISIINYDLSAFSGFNEFFPGAILYKHPGEIYIGGSKGIFTFDPNKTLNKTLKIPLYITDIQVFNESLKRTTGRSGENLNRHISLADTVILRHNQNMLTFNFVGLHYVSPGKIAYAYKLDGLENNWNFTYDNPKITYGNLSPRTYTFKVKASVLNQNQEQSSKNLVVIIKKPFWQKNWFRILAVGFISFIVYLLFLIRINILKNQKRKLEEKVIYRTTELKKANDLLSQKNKEIIQQKDEIERIAQELHEADQMKIRFFMNVSHEFRTPLTLILGPLENLKESLKLLKQNVAPVHLIEQNAKRLLRLVNQLLDLRKLETNTIKLKVSEGNIKAFTEEIFDYFDYMADRHAIDYQFKAKENDYHCYFDHDIVEKVIYNMLSNAFKYVNDHGSIILELESLTDNELSETDMTFGATISGKFVKISIKDNGDGIDQDNLPFIFDRFYVGDQTVHKYPKGAGIGLSLTKELIQLHKGTVKVHSRKNKGTIFTIILPVSKQVFSENELTREVRQVLSDIPPIIAYDAPISEPHEKESFKEEPLIMIVDDNPEVRSYIRDCLMNLYNIIEAENGKSGYQEAKKHIPDLIVSDIMMPVTDGYEFAKKVKQDITLNHIPVILLTARSGKDDELEGLHTGADDYITKPFYKEVLLARIGTILKNRKIVQEKIRKELIESNQPIDSIEDKFLKQVMEVCEQNLENFGFNVEQLCESLNLSQPQLYRKIKSLTGYSPFEFMRVLRLKKAAQLIRHDYDNISQIAYAVGFSDPKYFSKCFKALFGETPTKFKYSKNKIIS